MLSMPSRRLPSCLRQASSAATSRDPSSRYSFNPATEREKGQIMDFAMDGFVRVEPHAKALNLTKEKGGTIIDYIVSKALHYPYSMTIHEKASGKMVGFRLMSVSYRDHTKDFEPFELDMDKQPENVQILCKMLDTLKGKIWELRPEANKILRREITYVDPAHQRQGIAQYLLHLNVDFDQLRANSVDGIQSEASSHANQTLLKKNGYKELLQNERTLYKWSDGRPITLPDETKCIKLYYYNLRK